MKRIVSLLGLFFLAWGLALPAANANTSLPETTQAQVKKNTKNKAASKRKPVKRASATSGQPGKASYGHVAGLQGTPDQLELKSSVALVIDQETSEVLLSKNEKAVLPIASLTKLMTGLIISEAQLPMDEVITITQADVDTEKGSSSRLRVGAQLSRGELLHLALMSSENRAAHALGRTYPGGLNLFVGLMNAKARLLGMTGSGFVEPTGLSSRNQSSAKDLVLLVKTAYEHPVLRELSTSPSHQVAVGRTTLQYNNTNRLVKNPSWDIGLQKTGYISEAGQCLVMQTKVAGRKIIMVFLDSAGKLSRLGDAERVKRWVESRPVISPMLNSLGSGSLSTVASLVPFEMLSNSD
ncbi:MAG: serine hydrolase [Burkholderiaceae bacterium]